MQIGEHTVIAACTGISGSTRIGARCVIAGAVGVAGHLDICDDVVITGMSSVTHSLTAAGVYSGCIPVTTAPVWRRIGKRYQFFRYLSHNVARGSARGKRSDVDEKAKNSRESDRKSTRLNSSHT